MNSIWDAEDLAKNWSLSFDELKLLKNKPEKAHLGFVAQLKHYQCFGEFLHSQSDIASSHLEYLDVRPATATDKKIFSDWLITELFPQGLSASDAVEHGKSWFHKHKIEFPAKSEINRVVRSAFNIFEKHFHSKVSDSFSDKSKKIMDQCLDGDSEFIEFIAIKADPGRVGLESVLAEIEKLRFIRSLDLDQRIFQKISTKVLNGYYQRVSSESAWEIRQHPVKIRYSLLGIFFYFRQRSIIDGLLELLILIVHRLTVKAERKLTKELLRDFQKVHGKATLLFRIAEATLLNPEGRVKDVIFPVAGENILQNLLKEFKS